MSIENPITKERIDFRVTGAQTAGRYTEADLFVGPGGYAAAEHIHPLQEERFEIKKGVLRLRANGDERELLPGDVALVPPGTPHVWSNGGDDELHMLLRFTPALNTEEFFKSYFALLAAGKSNAKGMITNPLQLAVLMEEFSDFIVPTRPPRLVQRAVAALAPLAKRLGYRAHPDLEPRRQSDRVDQAS
jgi:quercetin dioxygenase-like cupin family protein